MFFKDKKIILCLILLLLVSLSCTRINNAQGWSGILVNDGNVVVTSMDGHIMVLNKQTGRHVWKPDLIRVNEKEEDKRASYGVPVVAEGIIFVGVYDGKIQAIEEDTGRIVETEVVSDDFEIIGGPLINDGRLFIGASDGLLRSYSLEFSNQQVIFNDEWEFEAGGQIWSTPVISNGIIIITSLDGNVYALRADTGELIWESETEGAVAATAMVHNDTVFVGSFDSVFYAFDLSSGEVEWTFNKASNWYWGAAVVSESTVFVPSLDGNLYALDVNSGKKQWELETEGAIVGSPAIVGDMIVVGSTDGEIRIAETKSGEILGSCDIGKSIESPISSEGSDVYFSVRDHSVRALSIKPNGNPDEKWDAPYFSDLLKDDKNPQPGDWSPDC